MPPSCFTARACLPPSGFDRILEATGIPERISDSLQHDGRADDTIDFSFRGAESVSARITVPRPPTLRHATYHAHASITIGRTVISSPAFEQ
jgi:hypothetical protein